MRPIAYLAAAAIIAVPTQLFAAPVSLDCFLKTQPSGEMQKFPVELNEETESASYPHPFNPGQVVRYRAYFTPGKVMFGDGTFTIDRSTLTFERRNTDLMGKYKGTDYGKCSIITAKRVF